MMHAVTIPEFGGPEVLTWAEVPDPECGPDEVVIDVVAAGVNRPDLLQRQGRYAPPPGASTLPGLECSGVISKVGPNVSAWQVGDEVCALLGGGGYAERVAVPAEQVLPIPSGLGIVAAAGLPETMCTVWSNVVAGAGLTRGDVLLVHGGGSGIGTTAIQVGVALGARVAATAGSAAKLQRCAELGAEILINYHDEDFAQVLADETNGHGADVVLDIVGAKYLASNLQALAVDGRLVVIGLLGGRQAELDLTVVMRKRLSLTGSLLRPRPVTEKAGIVARVRRDAWPLVAAGDIRPVIDRAFPMHEAGKAHEIVEHSQHVGKVLLVTDADMAH